VLGADSIYYTSDAMAAAGSPPGRYRLGRLELEVGADRVVRMPGKQNFAGSALRPIEGVFRAAQMLGQSWQEAWQRLSIVPMKLMGWEEPLAVGAAASFCLVKVSEDGQLLSLRVMMNGKESCGVE
jgi:N-acetylglucosamine-6-phosphate deacetylase